MNINISKIMNGWIVAISTPHGQTATFYSTAAEAAKEAESAMAEYEAQFDRPPTQPDQQ